VKLGSEADFSKLTVQGSWFQPVRSSVLGFFQFAPGWHGHSGGTSEVPLHERFYAGGSTTVRGYLQDAIGPSVPDVNGNPIPQGGQSMVVLNLELRLNPGEGLGFELFIDAGNVWPGQVIKLRDLRSSYGAGIRYGTPIGRCGSTMVRRSTVCPAESPGELHFTIGNTF